MQFKSMFRSVAELGLCLAVINALMLTGCGGGGSGGASGGAVSSQGLPSLPTASIIVDVNGDGKNDLIISAQNGGYSSPLVLINNGTGTSFTIKPNAIPPQYLGTNGSAVDIQSGDFNKDGKVDLLVVTVDTSTANFYNASEIQLFLGNGDGTFSDATSNVTQTVVTGGWTEHVRVADIDGDGFLDFVTTSIGSNAGVIYRNDGTGKFAPASISLTGATLTCSIGMLGVQTSCMSLSARDVLAGDVNNDGKLDLVSLGDGMTYINTSTPAFISFNALHNTLPGILTVQSGNGIPEGALVDVNGDGFLDVLSAGIAGQTPVSAYLNNGTGVFTLNNSVFLTGQPIVDNARQWLVADFNGDGRQDVFIAATGLDGGSNGTTYPGARSWLLMNNGNGLTDVTATNLTISPAYTHQAAIGDLNGDLKPDLFMNNAAFVSSVPHFWLNNGAGVFASTNPTIH